MELVRKAEKALEPLFKGLPALPKDTKKVLADFWPWLAGIAGILQLWAAWALYDLYRTADRFVDLANTWLRAYGQDTVSGFTAWVWIGIVLLAVDGVILLLAFPKLRARQRSGWDLLFLGALLNLVYGILSLFIDGRGFSYLLGSLVGSAIGFYLLFQVREYFGGRVTAAAKHETDSTDKE